MQAGGRASGWAGERVGVCARACVRVRERLLVCVSVCITLQHVYAKCVAWLSIKCSSLYQKTLYLFKKLDVSAKEPRIVK